MTHRTLPPPHTPLQINPSRRAQAAYSKHKVNLSKKLGVQRYKQILIVDMTGAGMSLLGSARRNTLKKVMSVGSDYFPETVWKIYAINTPMMFRAIW